MIFLESNVGPFYLTAEDQEAKKYPRRTGDMIKRKKKISELKAELAAKNLECKGKRKRIAQLAMAAKIDLEETIEKVEPGWVDQPKGMLQVAFERGMIDPSKFDPRDGKRQKFYSADGKNNEFDNLIEASSLRRVMEQMPDFVSEETLLQFHAKNWSHS